MSTLPTLTLNLCGEYFTAIKEGLKTEEYRLHKPYWKKRLEGREYSRIVLKLGYPKRGDMSKTIQRPWLDYEVKEITHPHFGPVPVKVFAIRVN